MKFGRGKIFRLDLVSRAKIPVANRVYSSLDSTVYGCEDGDYAHRENTGKIERHAKKTPRIMRPQKPSSNILKYGTVIALGVSLAMATISYVVDEDLRSNVNRNVVEKLGDIMEYFGQNR